MKKKFLLVGLTCMLAFVSVTTNAQDVNNTNTSVSADQEAWEQLHEKYVTGEEQVEIDRKLPVNARSYGTYPTRKGVMLATNYNFSFQDWSWTGHAGIIYNAMSTVEAFPAGDGRVAGVQLYKNDWDIRYSSRDVYAVSHKYTTTDEDIAAADWAKNKVGKVTYKLSASMTASGLKNTSEMNCVSLVYNAFRLTSGYIINQGATALTPMDLVQSSDTYTVYKNF